MTEIEALRAALLKTALPLEVLRMSGSDKLLSSEVQQAIDEGIAAVRAALARPAPDQDAVATTVKHNQHLQRQNDQAFWLLDALIHDDMDEIVADGGVTALDVVRQRAREWVKRNDRS